MIIDPYKILGISQNASMDEIKAAYRKKAKECHPDLHPDDPHATEKMNEVNEAYDMLLHPEKFNAKNQQQYNRQNNQNDYSQANYSYNWYNNSQNSYGQNNQSWQTRNDFDHFGDFFNFWNNGFEPIHPPQELPTDPAQIRDAIYSINNHNHAHAAEILAQVPSTGRNARWHYLFALAQEGIGNTMTALEEIQRAIQMDPTNRTYKSILQKYRQASQSYDRRASGFNMRAVDPSKICLGICIANMFCNFCCR